MSRALRLNMSFSRWTGLLLALLMTLPACRGEEEEPRSERARTRPGRSDIANDDPPVREKRPQAKRAQPQRPDPMSREPQPPPAGATWQEKQAHELSAARQFLAEVARNEGGATPPETLAKAFDQRFYPPGNIMVLLTLGEIVGRALLPNFDAMGEPGVARFKMGPWEEMTVVPDGGAFVRAAFEGPGDLDQVNQARDKLIKAGNLDMAAVYDVPNGEAWKALAKANPKARRRLRAKRWGLPAPVHDRGRLRYHVIIEPEMEAEGAIPSFHGVCRTQLRVNESLRQDLDLPVPYEYTPVEDEICLWVALAGVLQPGRDRRPIYPSSGPWYLPARAAKQGLLRGFVVTEIVGRYARAHVMSLSQEDRMQASIYVKGLYQDNPIPTKGMPGMPPGKMPPGKMPPGKMPPGKTPAGQITPRTITPKMPAKGR